MKRSKKIIIVFYVLSIITPYISTILFVRTHFFLPLLIDAICLCTCITTTVILVYKDLKSTLLISVAAMIIFILSYRSLLSAADNFFFITRQERLDTFVTEIRNYGKISEMTDGQRYFKSLNSELIEIDSTKLSPLDTLSNHTRKKYFITAIFLRDSIEPLRYEDFKNKLLELGLISFTTLDDGTISFTIDGFLDNCEGVAYSETGQQPYANDCGTIVHWEHLHGNWYFWYSS